MSEVRSLDFLQTRERFLPVPTTSIIERILEEPRLSPPERDQFKTLIEMIQARFHFEFLAQVERLKVLYDPFNPDRDTLPLRELSEAEREAQFKELSARYRQLLVESNYVELTRDQLIACMESRNRLGLAVKVNLDDYADLRVFYRGIREEERPYRSWKTWWLPGLSTVRLFSRVGLLVRAARGGRDVVLLKLFKDVVVEDLEMTSPDVRIRMRLLDRLTIGSTVAGGLFAPILKLLTAVFTPVLFLIVLGGLIAAFVKGVFSFLRCKTKYMQKLSSSLYFQNLANNTSALTHLVDAAEAEEVKELLLAYFILYVERNRDHTLEELDGRVEKWLREQFQIDVDFEADDAVRKLLEKDLMILRPLGTGPAGEGEGPQGKGAGTVRPEPPVPRPVLKVYDLPTALRRLDRWWDNYFTAGDRGDPAGDRLADGGWPPYSGPTPRRPKFLKRAAPEARRSELEPK